MERNQDVNTKFTKLIMEMPGTIYFPVNLTSMGGPRYWSSGAVGVIEFSMSYGVGTVYRK